MGGRRGGGLFARAAARVAAYRTPLPIVAQASLMAIASPYTGERGRTHCPSRPPLFAGAGRDGPLGMHAWAWGFSA
jgi:hypothetical protein